MSNSSEQVARLLALVPYLQRHPGIAVEQAAAEFGVSAKTLIKDLQVAYFCGLPGLMPGDLIEVDMEAVEGTGRIFLTNAEFLSRPLRFSTEEVLTLILGLRALRDVASPEVQTAVDSALAKLETAAGADAKAADRIEVRVQTGSEVVRDAISQAQAGGVRLKITYSAPQSTSVRVVDPHGIEVADGSAYLQAWSETPEGQDPEQNPPGWRSFRLDRIADAAVTEIPRLEHADEPQAIAGWLDRIADAALVEMTVAPEAAWITEYYPTEHVTVLDSGDTCVQLRVSDPLWLQSLLLRLGPGVRAVSPEQAAESTHRAADEAEAQYRALFGDA